MIVGVMGLRSWLSSRKSPFRQKISSGVTLPPCVGSEEDETDGPMERTETSPQNHNSFRELVADWSVGKSTLSRLHFSQDVSHKVTQSTMSFSWPVTSTTRRQSWQNVIVLCNVGGGWRGRKRMVGEPRWLVKMK
ncbi:hypothetical protein IF1G_01100 [Cordyceps javanica]|uniref:Uncharacterized protein n=1 Tax=Cordyceps javanica TaxID=43265 RepID=A0A545VHG6_9HYPO|nr:hypothetical protein IF1G_01100 [Cordyceps javanica]